jgi:hypothetical protein
VSQPGTATSEIDALATQLGRVAERLRTLSLARLQAPVPGWPSRVVAARALAQQCADVTAAIEGRAARPVPELADLAVGDQVSVCAGDLVRALRAGEIDGPALAQVESVRTGVEALRRLL